MLPEPQMGLRIMGGYFFTPQQLEAWVLFRKFKLDDPDWPTHSLTQHFEREGVKATFLEVDLPNPPGKEEGVLFVTCERLNDPQSSIFRYGSFLETDRMKQRKDNVFGEDYGSLPFLRDIPFVTIPDPFDTYSK